MDEELKLLLTGTQSAGWATMRGKVEVVSAYPITPQTKVVEQIATLVETGQADINFIKVESEHSAMAACIGASAAGSRTFTATSSHGLLFMYELLFWAAGGRFPIVMANINRSIGPPWGIWTDLNDSLTVRDAGWIQFYVKNNQESFDTIIQAYKISEHDDIMLPSMVSLEGFVLSHTQLPVLIPPQKLVDEFLPKYIPQRKQLGYWMDTDDPVTHGALANPEDQSRMREDMEKSMQRAKQIIKDVHDEFAEKFGRSYGNGLIETYRIDDAEFIILSMATIAEEAEDSVDMLRKEGYPVGLLRIRTHRPYPEDDILDAIKKPKVKFVSVLDRNRGLGGPTPGITHGEVLSILPRGSNLLVKGHVIGISGVDVTAEFIRDLIKSDIKEVEG